MYFLKHTFSWHEKKKKKRKKKEKKSRTEQNKTHRNVRLWRTVVKKNLRGRTLVKKIYMKKSTREKI